MEDAIPAGGANVELVGKYEPTAYEFRRGYWEQRAMKVDEHRLK
jgi:hypothetical protein